MARSTAERKAALLEKRKALDAQLRDLQARESAASRKLDTRRKIILGGALVDLAERDVLKPDTFAGLLVDQWMRCGISRYSWTSVQDSLVPMLVDRLVGAYQHANEFLIRNGVMPVIEMKSVIRRSADGSAAAAPTPASKSAGSRAGGASAGAARPNSFRL